MRLVAQVGSIYNRRIGVSEREKGRCDDKAGVRPRSQQARLGVRRKPVAMREHDQRKPPAGPVRYRVWKIRRGRRTDRRVTNDGHQLARLPAGGSAAVD